MTLLRYSSIVIVVFVLSHVYAQKPSSIGFKVKSGLVNVSDAPLNNAELKESLRWFFGGKAQSGWSLYFPLIARLINCDEGAEGEEFAKALSRWQKAAGLQPTGVLDHDSWMKMVEHWQKQRNKDRSVPAEEKLLTVSAAEFYSSERPAELRLVERETYAAYRKLLQAAAAELNLKLDKEGNLSESEQYLKIISAYRSPEYQRKLRAQSPNAGRAGLALNSPHFTGRALDIYVGGEPVSTKDINRSLQTNTKVYRWLVKNAGKFGFIPYFYEPWHWEYNPPSAN